MGERYPDPKTPPRVAETALRPLVELPYPPGNVAISSAGRVFFNYHPFAFAHRFSPATVFELVDGVPRPYPDAAFQGRYQGVFGMTVDHQDRLWVVEPAGLDHERTRVLAFDLATGQVAFEHSLPAGVGTFAQDLRVAPDGKTAYLADTGLFRFTPASLVVLDVASKTHREVLRGIAATSAQDLVITTPLGPHRLAYGLLTFAVGLDGIELSPDGEWLYFATMSHDTLYRIRTASIDDPSTIQKVGRKPLSDGITLDREGRLLITDVEHGGIARMSTGGALETLVSSSRVLWADGVVVDPGGAIVFTDSAIPGYIDQLARPPTKERLDEGAPYRIWRFRSE
jgi:hypothetical protein